MLNRVLLTAAIIGAIATTPALAELASVPGITPTAHLGITPPKVLDYTIQSARGWTPTGGQRDAVGDTFDAAALAQGNIASAYFIDDFPDNFLFADGGVANGGDNLTYTTPIVTTSIMMFQSTLPSGNLLIEVHAMTDDGSPWVAPGAVPPAPNTHFDSWRFDVGGFAAGPDILGDPNGPYTVVDSGIALWGTGGPLGAFALAASDFTAGLSGVGLVGLGGGDIAGFDLNEMSLFFEITPEPGTLVLLGMGGLLMLRRRNRA
ncbi:MAG: PEP-CTERM sorting domain-containing protein [Phycisphaerae bacterium]